MMSRAMFLILLACGALYQRALAQQEAIDPRTGAPLVWGDPVPDNLIRTRVLIDRMEFGFDDEVDTQAWDLQAWRGDDHNRWWLKTEGEGVRGERPEDAEIQVLYGRMVAPFWDLQLGLRQDTQPASQTYLVVGFQGVIPYQLEADAAVYLSDDGLLSLRTEFEYELLLTQRLILQPRLELSASMSEIPDQVIGKGLNNLEAGLRLRYEIRREFAPYLGWSWSRSFGGTADYRRATGEEVSDNTLVLGLRVWF